MGGRGGGSPRQSGGSTAQAPMAAGSLQDLIRKAYRDLSTRPGEWIRLADIHDQLPGRDKSVVDGALKALAVQPGVQIIPWDNRNALDARDRKMALRFGGEDNHAIRIES